MILRRFYTKSSCSHRPKRSAFRCFCFLFQNYRHKSHSGEDSLVWHMCVYSSCQYLMSFNTILCRSIIHNNNNNNYKCWKRIGAILTKAAIITYRIQRWSQSVCVCDVNVRKSKSNCIHIIMASYRCIHHNTDRRFAVLFHSPHWHDLKNTIWHDDNWCDGRMIPWIIMIYFVE